MIFPYLRKKMNIIYNLKKLALLFIIYTICLSVADNYDVKEVIFEVENQEIYKSVLKTIE